MPRLMGQPRGGIKVEQPQRTFGGGIVKLGVDGDGAFSCRVQRDIHPLIGLRDRLEALSCRAVPPQRVCHADFSS